MLNMHNIIFNYIVFEKRENFEKKNNFRKKLTKVKREMF